MSLLALCPKFSLSFTRFLNENGRTHTLLFRCPAFQDLLLYLGLFTLEKRQWMGRFCSWSSSSSLKNFWQCLFCGEKKAFVNSYLKAIHLCLIIKKGPTSISFGSCAFFTQWGKKKSSEELNIIFFFKYGNKIKSLSFKMSNNSTSTFIFF